MRPNHDDSRSNESAVVSTYSDFVITVNALADKPQIFDNTNTSSLSDNIYDLSNTYDLSSIHAPSDQNASRHVLDVVDAEQLEKQAAVGHRGKYLSDYGKEHWETNACKKFSCSECDQCKRDEDLRKRVRGNRDVDDPTEWGITIDQFIDFVTRCEESEEWKEAESEEKSPRSGGYRKTPGYVNGHQVNTFFVIPWTCFTGASVSLQMNRNEPKKATLMLSHSWSADIRQTTNILRELKGKQGIDGSAVVWFCLFSMYQPKRCPIQDKDDVGPSVADQLAIDDKGRTPFDRIIDDPGVTQMYVLLTLGFPQAPEEERSLSEVYKRLWCCEEIMTAVESKGELKGDSTDFVKILYSETFKAKQIRRISRAFFQIFVSVSAIR